jgi:protein-disulfide reductase (glutathione)
MMKLLVAVAYAFVTAAATGASDDAASWGPYAWESLAGAKAAAAVDGKPIMVLVYSSHCGACHQLRPKFASDEQLLQLSDRLHLVQLQNTDKDAHGACRHRICRPCNAPTGAVIQTAPAFIAPASCRAALSPDGGYVPRCLFLDSAGVLKRNVFNSAGNPKFKHFYPSPAQIVESIHRALGDVEEAPPVVEGAMSGEL